MRLEDYFEFVEPNHICIKGHRVGIESILRTYLAGRMAEDIACDYNTLRPLDNYATITPVRARRPKTTTQVTTQVTTQITTSQTPNHRRPTPSETSSAASS